MTRVRQMLSAFVGGEISPLLFGRVDTEQYAFGLALCENFVPINEGPLVKRPGFVRVAAAAPSASWLSAFRFSITQEYVIEWSHQKARFYTNGVQIEQAPGTPYEITTPYAAATARYLSTQQSFDRLYINHASHAPAAIARLSATQFVHEARTLRSGPFLDQNIDENIIVQASAASDSGITLTSSAGLFAPGHVGALLRIEANDFSNINAWEPGMKLVAANDIVRSDGKAYSADTAGTTGTIQPTHSSGAEWDGQNKKDLINDKGPYGVRWRYLHGRFGIVKITAVASATSATADVIERLPGSVVSDGSYRWSHAAFSDARGWPSLVCHWQGRQIHIKDFDIIGSVVGDFSNYAALTPGGVLTADLAFRRTLAVENPPLWVVGDRKLVVGTASNELAIGAINSAQAVAGDNIASEPQSFYGSERVFPLQLGSETIFIERAGRRLRAGGYDFARDRYTATDLTAASRHITRSGIIQISYQRVPHALLIAVRGDGQLVVHATTRNEVKGFARVKLGGGARALSAVSVVGADSITDELWLLIERPTPTGMVKEIWRQAAWPDIGDDSKEEFFVDGGVRIAAAAGQTVFTGLMHLAGQSVAVLAHGGVVPGMTVTSAGVLTLPAVSVPNVPFTVIVGLGYTARAETLRIETRPQGQTSQGLKQRVVKLVLRLLETIGMKAGGPSGPYDELIDRPANADMDAPIPRFTGDTLGEIDTSFEDEGRCVFLSDAPRAATINAAIVSIDMEQENA